MVQHHGSYSLEVAAAGPELDDDGHAERTGTTTTTGTLSLPRLASVGGSSSRANKSPPGFFDR